MKLLKTIKNIIVGKQHIADSKYLLIKTDNSYYISGGSHSGGMAYKGCVSFKNREEVSEYVDEEIAKSEIDSLILLKKIKI